MDYNFVSDLLKIMILLPLIILLIYISFNFGGKYLKSINKNRIIKIYERVPMGQNTYLSVISIEDKVYLISSSNNGIQILKEIDNQSIFKYENMEKNTMGDLLNKIKRKK
ncbi:flagellar protein FliO/FliZ [Caloramator quimbayensis]|uniref:Flagellar protein FliO/FliZ n=1 Tax=Caloramator quimbayensis TaxID=1147123 RepID=A0A1T4XA19_9CLOT|nr:flagellar biosynthetic protein FliO [Caloramator quimbayensis]SKA86440.1 flagellar protein FliO/FliZ [Caloramator quimbayensis]